MSETSKLRRRLRRKVARDEQLTPGQEQAFLRLMKVGEETVIASGAADGCDAPLATVLLGNGPALTPSSVPT